MFTTAFCGAENVSMKNDFKKENLVWLLKLDSYSTQLIELLNNVIFACEE